MGNVIDPGKEARKQARRQEEEIRKQRQLQELDLAEATDEAARKRLLATSPRAGRRSLIGGGGQRTTLG